MNKMVYMRKTLKMIKIEGVPNVSYGNVTNNKSKKNTAERPYQQMRPSIRTNFRD